MERKVLDSCGTSGTGETPQERSDEEAHRPPRGKRAPAAEIPPFQTDNNIYKTTNQKKVPLWHLF
ncbi:hypothetical protein AB986_11595 [Alkalihalobacillus macyae]|uniref:Uncharacterized protein n=1 Tax=Guptibacillus hwajinpoensis TaxID=208199 RepID=A0A0J6CU66_9BACL|nr:hypothetical protein AB986_11595 [Alkalihalobacillus macyae]